MNAYREVESLTETIRALGNNPRIDPILDEILVKCRAYMEQDQSPWATMLRSSPSRRAMFDLLFRRRGQVVSRSALEDVCVHLDSAENINAKLIDVHMCSLRKTLIGSNFENMIETVWGTGYRLRTEEEGPFLPRPSIRKIDAGKYCNPGLAA
jgi:hypothetical protein